MYCIEVTCFEQWRTVARALLQRHVDPASVAWQRDDQPSLLAAFSEDYEALPVLTPSLSVSQEFLQLAESVACCRDDARWALLYRVVWRLIFEDKRLLDDRLDTDVARLLVMHKAVSRNVHKMKAFVRFRKLEIPHEYYVAWFEPEHLIVPRTAPFFVKRFNSMCWSICTPDCCVHWDTAQLVFSPGLPQAPQISDQVEELWCQYYASIFNPARLKLQAMQSEMPKKYWKNLPEAPLITQLTRNASARTTTMLSDTRKNGWSKTENSQFIREKQAALRAARRDT
ncbi:TIGR03915 family putative DNA repair protein [Teredinibacter turnerae]|uniref:TIGR03915 family putative DNA repair protein n=1 Tax=Teredinibacter turnerae TaxID=2426 RepID=UPI000364C0BB|nr:TIGR03915 family putative DNA repair protein [Teredinibacter turnerae]